MKEILTTVTQRGQVTLPAEVRRLLGIKPRDKVAFTIEEGRVGLRPAAFTLRTAFGSVTPQHHPEDFEAIAQQAKAEHVERVLKEMERSAR
ncbi:MAG: AbrB/MazE/SpoVT family DNA-binding domain-containing protein [Chloroflexi bacterium]|nr:AbrB/MazE/SpoVT family DNA-binding domain-containing protein [Chloroflexota bacterium]